MVETLATHEMGCKSLIFTEKQSLWTVEDWRYEGDRPLDPS